MDVLRAMVLRCYREGYTRLRPISEHRLATIRDYSMDTGQLDGEMVSFNRVDEVYSYDVYSAEYMAQGLDQASPRCHK